MEKGEQSVKKTTKRKKVLITLLVLVVIAVLQLVWSNGYIDVEKYEYRDAGVPKSFDGTKIVAVTDYHNHGGAYEDRLVKKIAEQSPDYIFYVGDIIDSYLTDVDKAESFFSKCADIAPGYLVYGNHELRVAKEDGGLEQYDRAAEKYGIDILKNEIADLEKNGEHMYLAGTTDTVGLFDISEAAEKLDKSAPLLWIHHYPEDFNVLAESAKRDGFEHALIFSGHAHGGLVMIPFTRIGIYAPGQGFLPEYTSGEYFHEGSELILSRGCGNSSITLRSFDPFEIVVCELKSDK
ncbi:MAG: metallophosphoesterase family protein [Oscillospiraceae bacterium]|nr:metallophosphoesterase family protein [Oscillospiraceae bacterium]